ncbi:MAG: YqaJ viral recombinase family protein [Clostridia bacterium]|nr:YqaJ viral recombinase family protein [Clostridia bacterium]
MKIIKFDNEISWKEARKTKITGSRLKDIVVLRGTNKKVGFYELIAERLAIPRPDGENKMERGHELEPIAVELAEKELGKTFNKELVIWERDDNPCIAISPDGYTEDLKEAIEVKCLNSASQVKAIINNEPDSDYTFQYLQYFIVNDKLEKLHVVMYDPSLIGKLQYKRFEITREELKEDIEKYLEYQRKELEEVNEIVNKLSF